MNPQNTFHQQIIKMLKTADPQGPIADLYMVHYCGSDKVGYNLNTAAHTKIIKAFISQNSLTQVDFLDLISSLFTNGQSYNEIIIGGSLITYYQKYYRFDPKTLDTLLNYVHGWAETDVLCQSNFTPNIVLSDWPAWEKILAHFVKDANVHKRRASLVLLCKSLRGSPDPRLLKIAITNVELLKGEKDILITKAISWVLRSMVYFHKDFLREYLAKNRDSLPKIAYKEAYTKLTTGKKYQKKDAKINLSSR